MPDIHIGAQAGLSGSATEDAGQLGTFLRKDGQYVVPLPPDFTPADQGLQAWTFDPAMASASQAITSESLYVLGLVTRAPVNVNNALIAVSSAGTGSVTAAGVGLYTAAGTKLAHNTSASWGTAAAGVQTLALTAEAGESLQDLPPGLYFLALFAEQASTVASLAAAGAGPKTIAGGLAAATYRASVNGTSVTALPSSLTVGSNSLTSAFPFWAALS